MTTRREHQHDGPRWLSRLRVRAAVLVVGIPLAAAGLIAMTPAWAVLPVVGVAVAAMVTSLGKMTQRMADRACYECGTSLADEPPSPHGIVCPSCGALYQEAPFGPPSDHHEDETHVA
ncbi:MAG TPA: hypothetical protein VG797_06010 [Phycisphaerales bacterium]|nr:hypothetical protein [Phycisphaerales bacterium]